MGAGNIFGVEPDVVLLGGFHCQLIVLNIISADYHRVTTRCSKAHKVIFDLLWRLISSHTGCIARAEQLLADFCKILLCFSTFKEGGNTCKIFKLGFPFFYLICKDDLGGFTFIILLIEALGVLCGRESAIEGNFNRWTRLVIVIYGEKLGHTTL